MKTYKITIKDLGLTLESEFDGNTVEEAAAECRKVYAPELDCEEKDVDIVSVVLC